MGLEQVTGSAAAAAPVDYDRYRLRNFVEPLGTERRARAAFRRHQAHRGRAGARSQPESVLFDSAGRKGDALVGNVLAQPQRVLPQPSA